jgi:hypothetical protein
MKDEFIHSLPSGIFSDDDAFFGIVMNIMNIPIYVELTADEFGLNIQEIASGGTSAVAENVTVDRITNERNIFDHALENKMLPSQFRVT